MNDKEIILKMEEGEPLYLNMSEGGGAEIWKINDCYFLFEIPLYGGHPRYMGNFNLKSIDEMIKTYKSWT